MHLVDIAVLASMLLSLSLNCLLILYADGSELWTNRASLYPLDAEKATPYSLIRSYLPTY